MELELGLKITKTRDDISSISKYRLAKEKTGPVFQSRETSTMFILIANIKGYKKNNIGIKISEDGSKISISGEKPIQEMLMVGWVMLKKNVEITGFSKVFKIPDGVILDRIKAKYDEDEWILKIVMPKSVQGICGARIEEVEEEVEEDYDRGKSELDKIEGDQILKSVGETSEKRYEDSEVRGVENGESITGKKDELLYENRLHDANGNLIREANRNRESVRDKDGEKEYVAMKTLELEKNLGASIQENIEDACQDKEFKVQEIEDSENVVEKKERVGNEKMLGDANAEISEQTFGKEIEESKLDNKDRNGESVSQKVGKEGYDEIMKTSELEQNVGKEKGVHKMEDNVSVEMKAKEVSDMMLNDSNRNINGDTVRKTIKESKLGIEDGMVESVKENVSKAAYETVKKAEMEQNEGTGIPQNNGGTSQDKESGVIKMEDDGSFVGKKRKMVSNKRLDDANGKIGEIVQKGIEESKFGIEDRDGESVSEKDGKVGSTTMKTSEHVDNVADHNPSNIGGISQEDSEESEIQQIEKTENVEGKMDGGEPKRISVEPIPKNIFEDNGIVKAKSETENVDQELVREKAGKEEFETIVTEKEEVPKNSPKAIRMHAEAKRLAEKDKTEKTRQEKTERPKSETKDSDQHNVLKNTVRGGFQVPNRTIEEFIKQEGEKSSDEGKGLEVVKLEEPKQVIKEAMPENESLLEKVGVEESRNRTEEASKTTDKRTVTENFQKEIEEYIIERKPKDGANVSDNFITGSFEVLGKAQEKFPKHIVEATAGDKKDENEYGIVKLKREGSIKMQVEANEVLEECITGDRLEKEISEPKLKSSDQIRGKQKAGDAEYDGSKRRKFPGMLETEDVKEEGAEIEQSMKNVNGEKIGKIPVEANGGLSKDMTRETTRKDRENPKIRTNEKDQQCLREDMSKGRVEASNAAKEEFPMKIVDSVPNRRDGLEDTKITEAKEVKEELIKQKSEKKVEETEDVKDEGAKTEQLVNKVKGEKYGKIQVEANGGLMEDITRETTQKDREEPKIHAKEKDQQCLQTAREFPMPIVDARAKKREGPYDREIEEVERVSEETAKRNTDETKIVGSTTKEKLHEVPEGKHPKPSETRIPERELQSAKSTATWEKVVSVEFKENEKGIANNKIPKRVLLPLKNQSKSKNDNVKQGILKPNKAKVGEGEQSNNNRENTNTVASIEDQVAKSLLEPRFPIAQQSEAEQKDKLHEGFKAKDNDASLKSQKKNPTHDMGNSIEMKMETLKQEDHSEEHQKNRQQVTRRDEFYKGQRVKKSMQEKNEEPKNNIDDRDQQNVPDVGKGVEIKETKGKEMPTEECVADLEQIARIIDTNRDLEATLEREKFTTAQNVKDQNPVVKEEIRKAETEKVDKAKCIDQTMELTQEKMQPRKSDTFEKEAQPVGAVSSLPRVISMLVGAKNKNEEQPSKGLSPITEEMKSKEIVELEKHIMEWKFHTIKEHVPESTEEQYGYGTEDGEATKITSYQGSKPSKFQSPTLTQQPIDRENRKLENVVEAHEESKESSPKKNTEMNLKECNEGTETVESEESKTLQPHIPKNHCLEEKQKASGETKEASKQLLRRESGRITQTTEDSKKPKMKGEFEQFAEKMHETYIESEKITTKTRIVITPNKIVEEPPFSMEIQRKEPRELSWPKMEREISTTDGTTEPHVVTDEVTKPSKISSSSATQPFEDKEKDNIDASHREIESLQPDSTPIDQQFKNKDHEEFHGIDEIEDEKANEQDGTKGSKKLLDPLLMAGSALLVNCIIIFVRHRSARKSCSKWYSK